MTLVSPELALVDPALAASARAALPEPGCFRPASAPRVPAPRRDQMPAIPGPVESPSAATPNRRGGRARHRLPAVLAAASALVAAGLGSSFGGTGGTALPPVADASPSSQARATSQARAARTYEWPAVPGAATYSVRLALRGQTVYEATTRGTSLQLPEGLHLPPGRYTWSATPRLAAAVSGRAARPVVEGAFEVVAS